MKVKKWNHGQIKVKMKIYDKIDLNATNWQHYYMKRNDCKLITVKQVLKSKDKNKIHLCITMKNFTHPTTTTAHQQRCTKGSWYFTKQGPRNHNLSCTKFSSMVFDVNTGLVTGGPHKQSYKKGRKK